MNIGEKGFILERLEGCQIKINNNIVLKEYIVGEEEKKDIEKLLQDKNINKNDKSKIN